MEDKEIETVREDVNTQRYKVIKWKSKTWMGYISISHGNSFWINGLSDLLSIELSKWIQLEEHLLVFVISYDSHMNFFRLN